VRRRPGRGAPGDFEARLARAEDLLAGPGGVAEGPLRLLAAVVRHQQASASSPEAVAAAARLSEGAAERLAAGRFPLLDLDAAVAPLADGIVTAVAVLAEPGGVAPEPLAAAGRPLGAAPALERMGLVEDWLEDPAAPDPRAAFWVQVAAGSVLEPARAAIATPSREEWTGRACPACGGLPQVSVIAEESGEFMGGSPRSLVCGRCAGWWTFPRATCAWCGQDDPRRLASYIPDGNRSVRIDSCEVCSVYVKTFDLRQAGAQEIVPLVDDVATVALDIWAYEQGLRRPLVSLAGV
jgi:formate dehydrogenase maturation protein FdhE